MSTSQLGKYLIEGDRPLIVLPSLVGEVGLEPAIILQHLYWLLRDKRNGKTIKGKRWIYNTYIEWQEHFPWMTKRRIMDHFYKLEAIGAIESCQPEGGLSRRKYYRLLIGGSK